MQPLEKNDQLPAEVRECVNYPMGCHERRDEGGQRRFEGFRLDVLKIVDSHRDVSVVGVPDSPVDGFEHGREDRHREGREAVEKLGTLALQEVESRLGRDEFSRDGRGAFREPR